MKLTQDQCRAIINEMAGAHNKIAAIKLMRQYTNCGLKEAKDAIDKHCSGYGRDWKFNSAAFKAEWLEAFNPIELIAEFAQHVRRLEQIIVQFAELADGFQNETPPPSERVWNGDWHIIQVGDAVKYTGRWCEVSAVEDAQYIGLWPVAITWGGNTEHWLRYGDIQKDFTEVRFK